MVAVTASHRVVQELATRDAAQASKATRRRFAKPRRAAISGSIPWARSPVGRSEGRR
jgi:hypothetical protein